MAFQRNSTALLLLLASCSPGRFDVVGLAPDSLRTGMVAYWSCDEGTGSTLADHSGNGHDGAITGTTWTWIPGRFGNALHFESGDSVSVTPFPPATDNWSVSLWVRPASGDFGDSYLTLISTEIGCVGGWEMNARLTSSDMEYHFGYPRQGDAGNCRPYEYYSCFNCVDSGQWTHLVALVDSDAGLLSFYRNGVLQGTSASQDLILPGSATLYLARWYKEGRNFVGDLDDVVIHNRALKPAEIESLYAQPPSNPP